MRRGSGPSTRSEGASGRLAHRILAAAQRGGASKGRVVATVWTDPQTDCQYLIRDNAITPRMYKPGVQSCASGGGEALDILRSEVQSAYQAAAKRQDDASARSLPRADPGSPLRP